MAESESIKKLLIRWPCKQSRKSWWYSDTQIWDADQLYSKPERTTEIKAQWIGT